MDINIMFSGVAVAGMPSSFRASARAVSHLPAAPAAAAWPAAAVAPQRKRRPTAIGASVDWSLI